nr:hypothetical protein Iba_chr03cCG8840 [Ipomoea batatas]
MIWTYNILQSLELLIVLGLESRDSILHELKPSEPWAEQGSKKPEKESSSNILSNEATSATRRLLLAESQGKRSPRRLLAVRYSQSRRGVEGGVTVALILDLEI